jgi:hypothetical protein
MNITILAHRKVLLRAIAELKRSGQFIGATPRGGTPAGGRRAGSNFAASSSGDGDRPSSASTSTSTNGDRDLAASSSRSRLAHWSTIKPLADNEVSGDGGIAVNLADGGYDEAANAADFQVSSRVQTHDNNDQETF